MDVAEGRSLAEGFKFENRKVQQILVAASDLFLSRGYDSTSMDAIARAASVSKATLYSHFSNKETLFAGLIESEAKSNAERLRPPSLSSVDLEAALRQMASQFVELFLDPRGLAMHRLIFAEAARFPEIRRVFIKWGPHLVRRLISDLLREAKEKGLIDLPDPELGALHFIGLVVGDLPMEFQLGIAPRSAKALKRVMDSGISLFMKGYAVTSDPAPVPRKRISRTRVRH